MSTEIVEAIIRLTPTLCKSESLVELAFDSASDALEFWETLHAAIERYEALSGVAGTI